MGKTCVVFGVMIALFHNGVLKAADSFPPIVASASSDIWDLRQVKVTFSEEVVGALDPFVYHMEEFLYPNTSIAVTNVAYGTSSNVVLLYLEASRNPEVPYELHITLHNIEDRFGNPLADPTIVYVPVPLTFQNGALGYIGTRDSTLAEITPNADRGDDPTVSCDDSPRTHGLLQFEAVSGYGPRQIPNYVSCITKATLHLFTTDSFPRGTPVRMLRMLVPWDEDSTWNSLQNGIDQTNQVETGITDALIMGATNQTFVEIDVTAAVQSWVDGAPNYGWAFLATGPDGWTWASSESADATRRPALTVSFNHCDPICKIIEQPRSLTVAERQSFTLSVMSIGLGLHSYQWFKDGAPISGASNSTYTVFRTVPGHSGNYSVKVYNHAFPGVECASDTATVTVCCPPPPFQLVSAIGNAGQTTISLSFNDYVDYASAVNVANYTISGGLSIVGVSVGPFAGEVTLTNSPSREIGRNYTLAVRDVRNAFPPADLISPNPTVLTLTQDVRLLAFDSLWRYHNEGQDLGSEWRIPGYYDLTWPSGPGLLGFESNEATLNILSNQNLFVRTTLSRGNFGTRITDYFRTLVNIPFDTAGVTFNIRHVVDDGAVFYFNGVEAARFNMPDGQIDYTTLAPIAPNEGFVRAVTNVSGLRWGLNHVAVEVHQQTAVSGDVLFGAEIIGRVPYFEPRLTIRSNTDRTLTIAWLPASAVLQQADELDGDWTGVSGAVSPMRIPVSAGSRFYRLRLE